MSVSLTTPTIAKLVADGRLELPTTALSEQCSTTELIGNGRRTIGQIKIGSIAPHERMAFFARATCPPWKLIFYHVLKLVQLFLK